MMHARECCALLGVQPPDSRTFRTFDRGCEVLQEWKDVDLKRAYKAAALRTHPDRGGSEEEFVRVKAAYEFLRDRLQLQRPQARVVPRRTGFVHMGGTSTSASTSSTTSSFGGYGGATVTIIFGNG